jgi:hypothetical protein
MIGIVGSFRQTENETPNLNAKEPNPTGSIPLVEAPRIVPAYMPASPPSKNINVHVVTILVFIGVAVFAGLIWLAIEEIDALERFGVGLVMGVVMTIHYAAMLWIIVVIISAAERVAFDRPGKDVAREARGCSTVILVVWLLVVLAFAFGTMIWGP